jgi:hypothetical protein
MIVINTMIVVKRPKSRIPWKQLIKLLCPIIVPKQARIPDMVIVPITKKTNGSTIINSAFPIYISSFIVKIINPVILLGIIP